VIVCSWWVWCGYWWRGKTICFHSHPSESLPSSGGFPINIINTRTYIVVHFGYVVSNLEALLVAIKLILFLLQQIRVLSHSFEDRIVNVSLRILLINWCVEVYEYRMPYSSLRLDSGLNAVDGLPELIIRSPPELSYELCVLDYSNSKLLSFILISIICLIMQFFSYKPEHSYILVEQRSSVLLLPTLLILHCSSSGKHLIRWFSTSRG
jgi:hypothetical protein